MNGTVMKVRVRAPLEELTALEGALRGARVSTSTVGAALAATGSLLRRLGAAKVELSRVEEILRLLPGAALREWSAGVDLGALEARLRRATEEAVEASLPESGDESDTWESWAREGLDERDVLESQVVALRFREALGFEADRPVRDRLADGLAAQDRALRQRARWLVGLNAWRREERALLDPEHQAFAWWFVDRADCDALLPALAGGKSDDAHLMSCLLCQRDLRAVGAATARRERHLSEEELWNYDLGVMGVQERALLDRHVRDCGACAQAIAALEEGEDAIRDVTAQPGGMPTAGATVIDLRARMRPTEEPEVLADNANFRLLLFRRTGARVVLQPKGPQRIAAAALLIESQPHRSIAARAGADGWHFELGQSSLGAGAAQLRVRFAGASEDVECDVQV